MRSILASLLALALACSAPTVTPARDESTCVEGASAACACVGGRVGAQVCEADGTWAPCVCEPARVGIEDSSAPDAPADSTSTVDSSSPADSGSAATDTSADSAHDTAPVDSGAPDVAGDADADAAASDSASADVAPDACVCVKAGPDEVKEVGVEAHDSRAHRLQTCSPPGKVEFSITCPAGWHLDPASADYDVCASGEKTFPATRSAGKYVNCRIPCPVVGELVDVGGWTHCARSTCAEWAPGCP